MVIVDNGRGANEEARPGMGLGNMRERAALLPSGHFEFSSSESGTHVRILFSLRSEAT